MSDELDTNAKDRLVAATRGALAAVPFVGGLLGELVTEVIPGLRQDRIVTYLRLLEDRVRAMEEASAKAALADPEKIDLIERGGFQAARATSPARIAHIVDVVARGLETDEAEIIRRKRLVELLGEIDDDEVAILTAYGRSYGGGGRNAFAVISRPDPPHLGAGREVIDQNPFVAVNEGMILRKALPEGGSLFDQVGVVSGLGPEQCRFERARIAQAVRAAVAVDLVSMDGKNLDDGQVVRHSASFL